MGQQDSWPMIVMVIVGLILGGVIGATAFAQVQLVPRELTLEESNVLADERVKELGLDQVQIREMTEDELKALVDAEVEDLGLVEPTDREISLQSLLDQAEADLVEELKDEDDLRVCDGVEYDEDEFTIRDIKDGWKIDIDDADDNEYTVSFQVEVKYKDEDTCRANYFVDVEYDGDDVDVEIKTINDSN